MVFPNECKQLRKHLEPLTDAKHEGLGFSTSEIKIKCYTELHGYVTPLIRSKHNNKELRIQPIKILKFLK